MLPIALPSPVRLSRSLFECVWRDLADALQRRLEQRRERRELQAIPELSQHTLDDVGAPDWLRDLSAARREERRRLLAELRSSW